MLLTTTDHDFQRLAAAVDHLTALIRLSLRLEIKDMTILDDIQAAEDKLNDKLNSIASEQIATKTALDAKDAKIAELTSDILGLKNSGSASTGQLQAILDKANAMLNTADNDAQTEAIFGTPPASTETPPADVPPEAPAPADANPPVDAPPPTA